MDPETSRDDKQGAARQYLKYSGLAFQMIVVLLLALWSGQKLDEKLQMENPIFTVVLLLLGVFGSLFVVIRGVTRNQP